MTVTALASGRRLVAGERRLVAIMSADVVGYSRLMGGDEDGTLSRLKACRDELIGPLVAAHRGRIVNFAGDNALCEFPSVVEAVRCAVAIQARSAERQAGLPPEQRLRLRIGVNAGDVILDDGNLYGDSVNIAARLQALAEPGTVTVSRAVLDHVKDRLDLRFAPLGPQEVKNIKEPVEVWRVLPAGAAGALPASRLRADTRRPLRLRLAACGLLVTLAVPAALWLRPQPGPAPGAAPPAPARPSLAVLPFESPQAADGPLAAGLAEDILTELSRNRDLRVVATDSSFGLAGQNLQPAEIGRRLAVRYLLAGSVWRAGDTLRVNARLLDTATGDHVWADRFTPGAADLYAAEDGIVREITGRLASEVRESEKARALRRPPGSLDVYELTQRGLAEKHKLDRDSLIAARADLQRALELDPGYAPAQLYLAQVDLLDIGGGGVTGKLGTGDLPDLLARARHAVELDPNAPAGYRVLSQILGSVGDREGALEAAFRSVELAPSNADNLNTLGMAQVGAGRYEEALRSIGTALNLNPLGPPWYHVYRARALYALGRAEESLGAADACAVQAPRWVYCHLIKAASLASLGRQDEAHASVAAILALNPRYDMAAVARLRPFSADPATAARYLADLQRAGLPGAVVSEAEAAVRH